MTTRQLDHYLGRPVESIDQDGVLLVGGARILASIEEAPPDIKGWTFGAQILDKDKVQLVLRRKVPKQSGGWEWQEWRLAIAHDYKIHDTAVQPEPFQPGQRQVSYPVPPDPADQKLWDGPEEGDDASEESDEEI